MSRLFQNHTGTDLKGPAPCHCPYCGHSGDQNTVFTPKQIEYAKSVAIRKITEAVHRDLKSLEFDHKPRGRFWHRHQYEGESAGQHPIRYYREKALEAMALCDKTSVSGRKQRTSTGLCGPLFPPVCDRSRVLNPICIR